MEENQFHSALKCLTKVENAGSHCLWSASSIANFFAGEYGYTFEEGRDMWVELRDMAWHCN